MYSDWQPNIIKLSNKKETIEKTGEKEKMGQAKKYEADILDQAIWAITLNVNGLKSIIKVRDCQLGLSGPSMCWCLEEINIKYKDTYRFKVQDRKRYTVLVLFKRKL